MSRSHFPQSPSKVLNQRPVIVALAGPNGAGKTTFYHAHLRAAGFRFLNADEIASELEIHAYEAAQVVSELRGEMVRQKESFVFETFFSDPVGDKVAFLKNAVRSGYAVLICFIGIAGPEISQQRIAMRVSQGGQDVPTEKLVSRFPRTMANLKAAINELPLVLVFDNSDLRTPFKQVAVFESSRLAWSAKRLPQWLASFKTPERRSGSSRLLSRCSMSRPNVQALAGFDE